MKETTRSSRVSLLNPLNVWQPSPLLSHFLRLLWTFNLRCCFQFPSAETELCPATPKFQQQSRNTFKAMLPSLELTNFKLSPAFCTSTHVRLVSSVSAGRLHWSLLGAAAAMRRPVLFHTTNYPCPHADNSREHQLFGLCCTAGQKNTDTRSTYGIRMVTSALGQTLKQKGKVHITILRHRSGSWKSGTGSLERKAVSGVILSH